MMNFNEDTLVVVDIRDILQTASSYRSVYDFYKIIPLTQLIENILTVPALDHDFSTYIWDYLSNRLDIDNSTIDYDYEAIDIFIHTVVQLLDEKLQVVFPNELEYGKYVMDRWLDSTSIIMRKYEYFRITDFCEG